MTKAWPIKLGSYVTPDLTKLKGKVYQGLRNMRVCGMYRSQGNRYSRPGDIILLCKTGRKSEPVRAIGLDKVFLHYD